MSPETIKHLRSKPFPIQAGDPISWELADKAWAVYDKQFRNGQTVERIAERGGFGAEELEWLLAGAPVGWRWIRESDCQVDYIEPFKREIFGGNTKVRVSHPPSGASVECDDFGNRLANRILAYNRLCRDPKLVEWQKQGGK